MFCRVHTPVVPVAIPLLFEALRLNSRGHHNNLGILFLELVPEAL